MKKFKPLDKFEEYGCVLLMVCLIVINFGNVLSRYVFHATWSFSEEIMMIIFLWVTMLGTSLAFRKGEHLGLSIFSDIAPWWLQIGFIVMSGLLSSVLMILFIKTGITMIHTEIIFSQTTPVMNIPEPVSTISIPLLCLIAISRIVIKCIYAIKVVLAKGK